MFFYFISVLLLVIGGLVSVVIKDDWKLKFCAVCSGISTFIIANISLYILLKGHIIDETLIFSPIFKNIDFVIDPLSAFFLLVISIMSFLGILYANGYMQPYLNKGMRLSSHCLFLMILIASMLAVVTVQNALFFLVMWEIMSISSFFLVIFEDHKKEVLAAGIKYMVYMHISVIFIIAAFVLLNIHSQSYNFGDYIQVLQQNKHLANLVFGLSFIGFGTKAGFVPFHNWLPDAHPAAPSHVSGIMSGVMIKTGIYGILRMLCLMGTPSKFIAYSVLVIALLSALWGVLYAITQHDIKRLLAYHSLENIGIIGIGIGLGMIGSAYGNPVVSVFGYAGAILHVLNHSIFKMLLFFAAGNIYSKTHTRDIEMLGGLIKKMPYTALLFIIGSVAICGLPPFNGFISEFIIYAGIVSGLPAFDTTSFITLIIAFASLALIGTMAILCFTKASGVMLLGTARSEKALNVQNDVGKTMIIPMSILAIFTLLIGIFPHIVSLILLNPIIIITGPMNILEPLTSILDIMVMINELLFTFLGILVVVCVLRLLCKKNHKIHSTWGCGYDKANSRMQYTASSYADLFVSTLKPMFKRISHIKKPKDLFPKEAYYEVEIEDIEEAYIVKPLVKLDEKFLAKFEKIQNGNMQQYILFGLIFLVAAIIGLIYFG